MIKRTVLKVVCVWIIFAILHFAYELVPIFPLRIIAGVSESNYQHMKLGFFAYLFASIIEYVAIRKSIPSREGFVYSRLFTTTIYPWLMITVWYLQPVFAGPMALGIELTYSIIIIMITVVCAIIIEQTIEKTPLTRAFKIVVIGFFVIMFIEFAVFSFKLPWIDLFTGHIEHDH